MDEGSFNYTIQLNLHDTFCLVIGGGKVALRKAKTLLVAGANVTVIAPRFEPSFTALALAHRTLRLKERSFQAGDTEGAFLVIAATDNSAVNQTVAKEAIANRCLVNVTDAPRTGNFSVAGSYSVGTVRFTVSTGGNPRLTHLLLKDLENSYGPALNAFNLFLEEQRKRVKKIIPDSSARQLFWQNTLTSTLLQNVREGKLEQAKEIIIHAVDRIRSES